MPANQPPNVRIEPLPVNPRNEAQLMLGQIHGVVWVAVRDVDSWLEMQSPTQDSSALTAEDIRNAAVEIHSKFGLVQAALNTGNYDSQLSGVGFGDAQGPMKRKGFWSSMRGLFRYKKPGDGYIEHLRKSLRWSGTILGSLGVGLKEELEHIPGAALALEAIKEFVEVILHATEPSGKENPAPH
jgi:hypothetical protein